MHHSATSKIFQLGGMSKPAGRGGLMRLKACWVARAPLEDVVENPVVLSRHKEAYPSLLGEVA